MALDLDRRQRAMLLEMGVRVWAVAPAEPAPAAPALPQGAPTANGAARATSAAVPVAATADTASAKFAGAPRGVDALKAPSAPTKPTSPANAPHAPMPAVAEASWTDLLSAAQACNACGLCAGRRNTTLRPPADAQRHVANRGAATSWMVIGEPPDEEEDQAGHPFAGPSGTLLDNMLRALDLARDGGAYLTNIVKCRPPHGGVPQAADLRQCTAYLQREIVLVQPAVILAMGRFAQQALLTDQPELASLPLGKLRGTVHRYRDIPVVFTYHPKLLLRNAADKAKAWADLCLAAAAAAVAGSR